MLHLQRILLMLMMPENDKAPGIFRRLVIHIYKCLGLHLYPISSIQKHKLVIKHIQLYFALFIYFTGQYLF